MTYTDFAAFFGLALFLDFLVIVTLRGLQNLFPSAQQHRFFWARS